MKWNYDGTTYFLSGENAPLSFSDLTNDQVYSESFTILEPDQVQTVSDIVVLKKFIAESYPNGVTLTSFHVSTSANSSDTYSLEEATTPDGVTGNSVCETVTLSAADEGEDDGTFTDGDIAADSYLLIDLDGTPDDIAYAQVTISYTID